MIEIDVSKKLPIIIEANEKFVLDEGENVKRSKLAIKDTGALIVPDRTALIWEIG